MSVQVKKQQNGRPPVTDIGLHKLRLFEYCDLCWGVRPCSQRAALSCEGGRGKQMNMLWNVSHDSSPAGPARPEGVCVLVHVLLACSSYIMAIIFAVLGISGASIDILHIALGNAQVPIAPHSSRLPASNTPDATPITAQKSFTIGT